MSAATGPTWAGTVSHVPSAVGSLTSSVYLYSLLSIRPFTQMPVKGGDKIDLGNSHVLEFVMAPNLHWPDTMFTFDHATNVM